MVSSGVDLVLVRKTALEKEMIKPKRGKRKEKKKKKKKEIKEKGKERVKDWKERKK